MDGVSVFCDAVSKSLRAGVNRQCKFTVEMRTDVFKYLFKNKGSDYEHGLGRLYTESDFDRTFFPTDWYRVRDSLGDGCEVEFPVCMCSKVQWSPTVYTSSCSGSVSPKPKYYKEICFVKLVKKCC